MNSRDHLKLALLDYFDSPDGAEYLKGIFNEVVDILVKENPGTTREDVITRFKALV